MVHVLGNLTDLMEDLPKSDVESDFFFCLIVYPSALTHLFLECQELWYVHRRMGDKQRVSGANSIKTCFVKVILSLT